MLCIKCGKTVDNNVSTCPYCGENLDKVKRNAIAGVLSIIVIIFLAIFTLSDETQTKSSNVPQPTAPADNSQKADLHHISKDTFQGEWAFTVDELDIYCVDLNVATGARIVVNGKSYAISHNIPESRMPFMPDSLWANKPADEFGGCEGAYLGDGVCKVSLAETNKYVDSKLCAK